MVLYCYEDLYCDNIDNVFEVMYIWILLILIVLNVWEIYFCLVDGDLVEWEWER